MYSTASIAASATPRASAWASRSCARRCARSAAASSSTPRRAKARSSASSSPARACAKRCRHERRLDGAQQRAEAPTWAAPELEMTERILLVDDDAGVRDVVAFPLRREGFEV